jgi:hypothetical protein
MMTLSQPRLTPTEAASARPGPGSVATSQSRRPLSPSHCGTVDFKVTRNKRRQRLRPRLGIFKTRFKFAAVLLP